MEDDRNAKNSNKIINNAYFEHLLMSWYFSAGLVNHQIESFNKFVTSKLEEIILENSLVSVESERTGVGLRLIFNTVYIRSPALREADGSYHRVTPHECRLRGLSYNMSLYVNVTHETWQNQQLVSKRMYTEVLLCRIPCMVRSIACSLRFNDAGECPLDPGGYFVVNGNEKSVVAQEKMRTNYIFIKRVSPRAVTAEIRSLHSTKTRSTSTLNVFLSSRAGLRGEVLEIRLPFVDMSIPAGVIFKVLGFDSLHEICEFITTQA